MRWFVAFLIGVALAGCANTPENKARQTIAGLDLITEHSARFLVLGNKTCADKAVAYGKANGKPAGEAALLECYKRRDIAVKAMHAALGATTTAIPTLDAAIAIKSGNYSAALLPAIQAVCALRALLVDMGVTGIPNPMGVCS